MKKSKPARAENMPRVTDFQQYLNCSEGLTAKFKYLLQTSWWRGTVVERRSLDGELSLSCARPAADG